MSAIATIVFTVILFRTAWISDDAAITLRTVLNVTHGFGPTFNIAERVQTYTHPLWMGLLTIGYLVVGNVYITMFAIGMALSVIAFWLALTRALSPFQAISASIVLLFSTAFIDFSTSGLENPLLNVLVAVFAALDHPIRWRLEAIMGDGRRRPADCWLHGDSRAVVEQQPDHRRVSQAKWDRRRARRVLPRSIADVGKARNISRSRLAVVAVAWRGEKRHRNLWPDGCGRHRLRSLCASVGSQHNALGHLLLEGNPATDWELYRRVAMRDRLIATKQLVNW